MSEQEKDRLKTILDNPIYNKLPNRKRKVKVDERFSGVLTDPKFTQKRYVDKRGRKVTKNDGEHLKMMYEVDDESSVKVKARNIRGEKINSESSELDSDEMDEEDIPLLQYDNDAQTENDVLNKFKEAVQNTTKLTTNLTKRLAICNMDWDRIDANDVYMIFQSFLPENGHIVFISTYGKEKLNKETQEGPEDLMKALDETQKKSSTPSLEEFNEAYREYQLQRMKYYYAVIEFDSKETADHIYTECDDMDYEHSAISLDIRFVPDDVEFDQQDIKSSCSCLDENYKPLDFYMDALQQTKLKVTWDEPDPKRMILTSRARKYTAEDIMVNSADLDNLIASPSSSHDEDYDVDSDDEKHSNNIDNNSRSQKYKALLEMDNSSNNDDDENSEESESGTESDDEDDEDDDDEIDMSEFQMPEQLKKAFQHDPLLSVKPSKNRNNQKPVRNETAVRNDTKQVSDSNEEDVDEESQTTLPGLHSLMKKHKISKSKAKKIIKQRKLNKTEEHFELDTADSRFSSLFDSAEFAVDPSHQRFRDSKSMNAVLQKQTSQRSFIRPKEKNATSERDSLNAKQSTQSLNLNNLVEAVKKIKPKSVGGASKR